VGGDLLLDGKAYDVRVFVPVVVASVGVPVLIFESFGLRT